MIRGRRVRAVLGVVLVLALAACANAAPADTAFSSAATNDVPPTPSTVPITLYFRDDGTSLLEATQREIPRSEDPAREALELLIDGPAEGNGQPVVPSDVRIVAFSVRDGVAHVVLDGKLDGAELPQAVSSGSGPAAAAAGAEQPLLSLAAIANTLTEFPSITAVSLTTDDEPGAFSGWGMPGTLVRDESFVGPPPANDPFSALSSFTTTLQSIGARTPSVAAGPSPPPAVVGARIVDRLAYTRIIIQLEQPTGSGAVTTAPSAPAATPVPATEAAPSEDGISLSIADATLASDVAGVLAGPGGGVEEVVLRSADTPGPAGIPGKIQIDVHAEDGRTRPFHLLSDANPTRIILDVKK